MLCDMDDRVVAQRIIWDSKEHRTPVETAEAHEGAIAAPKPRREEHSRLSLSPTRTPTNMLYATVCRPTSSLLVFLSGKLQHLPYIRCYEGNISKAARSAIKKNIFELYYKNTR